MHALNIACAEARKWLGATYPNPPVGAAALDKDGNLIAVTAHQKSGEAHAEAALLQLCREQGTLDKIHTMCVTLEPCNHHGRTPPCTEAIIAAGIKRVIIGARDPNPNVAGGGIERLQAASIQTELAQHPESQWLLQAFAHSVTTQMPWVTVKRAFDRNGSMIPPAGQKTFTSPASLKLAHQLRKKCDAIITGSGTILADNPQFTVRHVSDHSEMPRFLAILDRRKRVPEEYINAATIRGFEVLIHDDIGECLHELSLHRVRDVLVEAGPTLSEAILNGPSWAMEVIIKQGLTIESPDKIDVHFRTGLSLPAPAETFQMEYILPVE